VATPLLHYVPSGIPGFTDHGTLHTVNVLRYIWHIEKEYPTKFTTEEKVILSLSSVFHDIGCIAAREKHNEASVRILSQKDFDMLRMDIGKTMYRALITTILAHSRAYDLMKVDLNLCPEIRLRFICAMFRLADACDQSASRVKELLFKILLHEKLLDKTSKDIWKAHLSVENILIKQTRIEPRVYSLKEANYCIQDLVSELTSINQALTSCSMPIYTIKPVKVKKVH
jgi:hypothetical protein